MSAPDTSAEAVERVAQLLDEVAEPLRWNCATRNEAAALLRALVAERDHACARGRDEALARAAERARVRHLDWRLPHPADARDGEVCDDESCCADIANAIAGLRDDPAAPTAYARGFREGAEQMREAAAGRMHRIAENERATKPYAQNDDHVMRIEDTAFALDQHGRAIRALPLPEPQA